MQFLLGSIPVEAENFAEDSVDDYKNRLLHLAIKDLREKGDDHRREVIRIFINYSLTDDNGPDS